MKHDPIQYPLQESWPAGLYEIQSKAGHTAESNLRYFENETIANNLL